VSFLVEYSFIFTLQEFARELASLVDAMGRIYTIEQERVNRGAWWMRTCRGVGDRLRYFKAWWVSAKAEGGVNRKKPGLKRSLCTSIKLTLRLRFRLRTHSRVSILAAMIMPRHRHTPPSFPKVRPHAPNTIQTPPRDNLTFIGRVKQSVWAIGKRLTERDTKYAVKAGIAMAILAAPAFFDSTRPIFVKYWGDWALISVGFSCTFGFG
jgi:hypothetical protein